MRTLLCLIFDNAEVVFCALAVLAVVLVLLVEVTR